MCRMVDEMVPCQYVLLLFDFLCLDDVVHQTIQSLPDIKASEKFVEK